MRAIDCPCGHTLEASTDDELVGAARAHIEDHHPDMERTDEQLRNRVSADAYDVETSRS